MKTKHTPGPWTANKPTINNGRAEVHAGSVLVAQAFNRMPDDDGNEQCWNDAHLIAAAPDMLKVLQEIVGVFSVFAYKLEPGSLTKKAQDVIDKALGVSK